MPPEKPSQQRILIVEDEDNARKGYEALLRKWSFEVLGVASGEEALAKFQDFQPSVILADVELPGMNGLDLLAHLGEEIQRIPVIIITGRGSDERVVQAIDAGAYWYIEKPLKPPVLRALLDRAFGRVRDQQAVAALTRDLRSAGKLGVLVGTSPAMQDVMRQVEMAAPSTASVLITGETGSGKEMVARSIHMLSPRAERPFVAINCSAIPESLMESEIFGHEKGAFTGAAERRIGCFELADGGTLLLDEIGEMPAQTQAKLLRVLEDRKVRRLGSKVETPVDVRVLAATNKNPEQAVADGHLRQDLYFRLNVFHIHLPPMREHKGICRSSSSICWRRSRRSIGQKGYRRGRGRDGSFQVLSLAWERARAPQCARTFRDRLGSWHDQPPASPVGLWPRTGDFELRARRASLSDRHHGGRRRARAHLSDSRGHQPEQDARGRTYWASVSKHCITS
jgi:DNA-binding NtrC family response regulator